MTNALLNIDEEFHRDLMEVLHDHYEIEPPRELLDITVYASPALVGEARTFGWNDTVVRSHAADPIAKLLLGRTDYRSGDEREALDAALVQAVANWTPSDDQQAPSLTSDQELHTELVEMLGDFIEVEIPGELLDVAIYSNAWMVGKALEWGWSDTEVREQALESIKDYLLGTSVPYDDAAVNAAVASWTPGQSSFDDRERAQHEAERIAAMPTTGRLHVLERSETARDMQLRREVDEYSRYLLLNFAPSEKTRTVIINTPDGKAHRYAIPGDRPSELAKELFWANTAAQAQIKPEKESTDG